MMTPSFRIYLLGTPYFEHNGTTINFTRRKAVALLAYLALAGKRASRDQLASLLWPNYDDVRARAGLRRVLADIGDTPAGQYIDADRDLIELCQSADLFIDVDAFHAALRTGIKGLETAVDLFRDRFMAGFTLTDSAEFDAWQTLQTQILNQELMTALERLTAHYVQTEDYEQGLQLVRRWLLLDPLHEFANTSLVKLLARTGQRRLAVEHYEAYRALLHAEIGVSPGAEITALYHAVRDNRFKAATAPTPIEILPALPRLVVGREGELNELRARLTEAGETDTPEVVVQGWPGIGKTTLSALVAHDHQIHEAYPDGVLWVSLGESPNVLSELLNWGCVLGFRDVQAVQTIDQVSGRLASALRERRMLLIVDDVWEVAHGLPFRAGGRGCGLLITTRFNDVAAALASRSSALYKLPILSETAAFGLLETLAPEAVARHPDESLALVRDLEGLPLAIQVAGRMLHAEMALGWGAVDLLAELRAGTVLLNASVPPDVAPLVTHTTPTVAVLLRRSVARLSAEMQEKFALLGVFAPKPATFTLDAMRAVWAVDNPRPAVKALVERGLLEPAAGAFQMHALLVMQARSMFEG